MAAVQENLRRTPLYKEQAALGARFVGFAGWEMPIQFEGILKEHKAVRAKAGLFDVSHMGQVFVRGAGALDFLQFANCNDISKASPGRSVYSHLLNERGGVVDDVIVYGLAPEEFLVVVNAATREKDLAHLRALASGFDVEIVDASDQYGIVALQGPLAKDLIRVLSEEAAALPTFGLLETALYGSSRAFVSRTGYTGEHGYEIIAKNGVLGRIWQTLIVKGRSLGAVPCGLGARDTLRLEVGYLLYGHDIDDETTPYEARYGWVVKPDKGDFFGKKALLERKAAGWTRRLTGFKLLERGVPREGAAVYVDGAPAGTLSSAAFSPSLECGIGMGYVDRLDLRPGQAAEVEIRGRRFKAEVAKIPFYKGEVD